MSSIAKTTKRRKKTKRLGPVKILRAEEYADFDVETKVECIQALIPLGLMRIRELLEDEVRTLAGIRYARKVAAQLPGYRHGSNPGSVRLAGQRHPCKIPRIQSVEGGGEIPLESLAHLRGTGQLAEVLLKRVLYGISCRNYEAAAAAVPGAIGLSSSTVSRNFTQASAKQLKGLQERDLRELDLLAIFLDGKTFAEMTMVAVGVTLTGEKHVLGFVETGTENEPVLTSFLRELEERGLTSSQGLLFIIDGGKGLRAAVRQAFGTSALVQRCQWHKRENVVRHLPKGEQATWRRRLQRAYQRPTYVEARAALTRLQAELEDRNQSAARSLAEGLEETLTLHRLGVLALFGLSFKTTNCLESINALVEERCAKVDRWTNSNQRQRWLATAWLDIEPRLRRVKGYRHLSKLREALQRDLNMEKTASKKVA